MRLVSTYDDDTRRVDLAIAGNRRDRTRTARDPYETAQIWLDAPRPAAGDRPAAREPSGQPGPPDPTAAGLRGGVPRDRRAHHDRRRGRAGHRAAVAAPPTTSSGRSRSPPAAPTSGRPTPASSPSCSSGTSPAPSRRCSPSGRPEGVMTVTHGMDTVAGSRPVTRSPGIPTHRRARAAARRRADGFEWAGIDADRARDSWAAPGAPASRPPPSTSPRSPCCSGARPTPRTRRPAPARPRAAATTATAARPGGCSGSSAASGTSAATGSRPPSPAWAG